MRKYVKATNVVLFLLCVMYLITYIDRVNISTAASVIKTEFGLSNTQLGLIFSAFAYPYAIFQIIGGWVGDHFGPRRTLFACGLIWALATVLTGFAAGIVSLFYFCSGSCSGLAKAQRSQPQPAPCSIGPLRADVALPKD